MDSTPTPTTTTVTGTRTNAAGLEVTTTLYEQGGRRSVVERTEPFLVEAHANVPLLDSYGRPSSRGVHMFKGERGYLWRSETVQSDYGRTGDVSLNGHAASGNRSLSFRDDAEAGRYLHTVRDADGKAQRAADDADGYA